MNAYLEQESVWHDFQERLCPVAAELLTAQVRPHYIVKLTSMFTFTSCLPKHGSSSVVLMLPSHALRLLPIQVLLHKS
jgi:hypothetical protein